MANKHAARLMLSDYRSLRTTYAISEHTYALPTVFAHFVVFLLWINVGGGK